MPREIMEDAHEKGAVRVQLEEVINQLKSAHEVLVKIVEEIQEEEEPRG